jgi:HlyD family secretion protein
MIMQWSRQAGFSVAAVVVVLAIAYGYWPKPVLIDAVEVGRGPLQVTVEEEGKTRVSDRFVISAPIIGFARRIELDVGDSVSRDQVVVEMEPLRAIVLDPRSRAEAQARVAAAKAALRAAQESTRAADAEADYAASELERFRLLYENNAIAREELEQAQMAERRTRANRSSAEFAVEVAQFELKAAQTTLQYSAAKNVRGVPEMVAIRAPVKGRVLKIYRESEGVVKAGQPLLEIGDPRTLEVEVDVLSADAVRIRPGTRVLLERWGGADPLEGRVRRVEPVGFTKVSALGVEEQRVLTIVDITSPGEGWKRLGDGYRVEARFIIWEDDDVLQIPTNALFRSADGWAVFVIADGKAERRSVKVGQRSGLAAQILAGLSGGEVVIAHPSDSIDVGTGVRRR